MVSPDRWGGGPIRDPLQTPTDERESFGIRVSVMSGDRGSPNDRLVGTWMADDGNRSRSVRVCAFASNRTVFVCESADCGCRVLRVGFDSDMKF